MQKDDDKIKDSIKEKRLEIAMAVLPNIVYHEYTNVNANIELAYEYADKLLKASKNE